MTDASPSPQPQTPGLLARVIGVITSPRETYAAVAARPRVLGVLFLTVALSAGVQYWFLSSEGGHKAALDQIETQVRLIESFGQPIDDAAYNRMIDGTKNAPIWGTGAVLVSGPINVLILSAIFLGVFNGIMGGSASFKQVCAIVAHSGVIWGLLLIFNAVMGYYTGRASGTASLSVFLPMLETGFFARLLGYLDLFWFWGLLSTATGLAVLYRRPTGAVASVMIGLYVIVGIFYAAFRSMLGV